MYFLLNNANSGEYKNIQNIELSEQHSSRVKKFCNQVMWRNSNLRQHFSIAEEVYLMTLPNKWEMILQDFFYEGVRTSYWWMSSVEYSLQYVNFYKRWEELKEDIGNEYIKNLLELLEKNQNNLPEHFYRLNRSDLEKLRTL